MLTFARWWKAAAQLLSTNITTSFLWLLIITVTSSVPNVSQESLEINQQYPDWLRRVAAAVASHWKTLWGSDELTPLTCEKLFFLPEVKHVQQRKVNKTTTSFTAVNKLQRCFTLLHRSKAIAGNQRINQLLVDNKTEWQQAPNHCERPPPYPWTPPYPSWSMFSFHISSCKPGPKEKSTPHQTDTLMSGAAGYPSYLRKKDKRMNKARGWAQA